MLSAMLIAPAVFAATGQRVGVETEVGEYAAADPIPYESCLEVCIDDLERDFEIFYPDFSRAEPLLAIFFLLAFSL